MSIFGMIAPLFMFSGNTAAGLFCLAMDAKEEYAHQQKQNRALELAKANREHEDMKELFRFCEWAFGLKPYEAYRLNKFELSNLWNNRRGHLLHINDWDDDSEYLKYMAMCYADQMGYYK